MNFLLLFTVGLDLTGNDFSRLRRQPALIASGLVAPLVLLPAIAVGLIWFLQPGPAVAASLLLIAACPIGGISNTFTYLARASTALSVTLTGLSCIAASVTIPLVGKALEISLRQPFAMSAPLSTLIGQLVVVLGLPVTLGMWIRRSRPSVAEKLGPGLRPLAFLGTAIVLLLIIVDAPAAFVGGLTKTVPLAAVFVLISIVTGWMTAALVTKDRRDRFTMAAQFGSRNVGIAMAIAVTILGRVEFASFAVIYSLTEIPLMLGAIALFKRQQEAEKQLSALSRQLSAEPPAGILKADS
jgi:BASS family bile acid:Na+ symporter